MIGILWKEMPIDYAAVKNIKKNRAYVNNLISNFPAMIYIYMLYKGSCLTDTMEYL